MRLMHNLASLNIFRNYSQTLERQSGVVGKISSGYKINSAKEDANSLAKSERMRMQIRGLNVASKNAQDSISMLQTAESGIEGMTSVLQRIKELSVRYDNGTNNNQDKEILQNEISELVNVYDDICKNTEFNGRKLLCSQKATESNPEEIETTIGANVGENMIIKLYNLSSNLVGKSKDVNGNDVHLSDLKNISKNSIDGNTAIGITDEAIDLLLSVRSNYGALENKFESTMNRVDEIGIRVQGAESQIRDADIAEEALNFSRDNILIEASNAMMVQSNKFPQDVLKILENLRSR